jgi:uncharacterized protein YacL
MALWVIRILFLSLSTLGGYAVSQVRPELLQNAAAGAVAGFGFGGVMIAIDEMLKGFSLRAFSAATFGLLLGTLAAWTIDHSGLFVYVEDEPVRWLVRLCLFLSFGYIGMVLAMRSNKEDFSLIIPFVRFKSQHEPENLILLDTSAIIDGRVADLIEARFLDGMIVVPRFVLVELQQLADSADDLRRVRGRRGLDILSRLQRRAGIEFKILDTDIPEESSVDLKLVRLAQVTQAKLYTNDYNLGKIAELQKVSCVIISQLASAMKPVLLPGDTLRLRITREGKDKGQGVGYMSDGTMVVVNQAQPHIGQEADIRVLSLVQTGAGVIVFAELAKSGPTA